MYLSPEAVNWVCTNGFAVFTFIGLTSGFLFCYYYYYIIYVYILAYHLCYFLPVSYSYHIEACMFPAWYHLLSFCLLLYAYTHDTVFNTCSFDSVSSRRVFIPARHLAFTIPLVGEFLTPLDSHVQIPELGAFGFPSCWSEWRSSSVDHRQNRLGPNPFRPPARLSSFLFVTCERPFV